MADEVLTSENSTPAERAQARREMIAAEVAREREEHGDRAARKLEKRMFDSWKRVLGM